MRYTSSQPTRGFSLVTVLVYVAIFSVLAMVIVNAFIIFKKNNRTIRTNQAIEAVAQTALERMVREIRGASAIDTTASTLGTSPGVLTLTTTDSSDNAATIQFFVSNGAIHLSENGIDQGPLSGTNVTVSSLVFRQITSTQSKAVKIEMTITSNDGSKSKNFYSTVVLRGSYPLQ